MARRISIVLLFTVLFVLMFTSCSAESNTISVVDTDISPVAEIVEEILPSYDIQRVSHTQISAAYKKSAAVEMLHTSANQLECDGKTWYPLIYSSVIIAVDRAKTDVAISDWRDLPDANVPVCFFSGTASVKDSVLAMSYGLDGNYSIDKAINTMRYLFERNRLIFLEDGSIDNPFAYAPVCVMLDCDAMSVIADGEEVEIIVPSDGTLTYEIGLFADEKLPIDMEKTNSIIKSHGLKPVDGSVATVDNLEEYNNVKKSFVSRARREIYGASYFFTADGNEHIVAWLILLVIVVLWGSSIIFRVVHRGLHRALIGVIGCLIFCSILRIFRQTLISVGTQLSVTDTVSRICWYGYYIPMIFVPLLLLWAAWTIGKPPTDAKPPKCWFFLAGFACILVALVISNDWHELVFTFDQGFKNWEVSHGCGFIGYIMYAFEAMLYCAFLVMVLRRQAKLPEKYHIAVSALLGILIPLSLVLNEIYNIGYAVFSPGDITLIACALTCMFCEICILSGTFPSNMSYKDVFNNAYMWIKIKNKEGKTVFSTTLADENDVEISDGTENIVPIPGGTVVWRKKSYGVSKLPSMLQNKRRELEERNIMLKNEQSVRDELTTVTVQNKLMGEVIVATEQSAREIEAIIDEVENMPPKSKEVKRKLIYASIIASHMKQKSELYMRSKEKSAFKLTELSTRMSTAIGQLNAVGVSCVVSVPNKGAIMPQDAMLLYDCFACLSQAAVLGAPCDLSIIINISTDISLVAFYESDKAEMADSISFRLDDALQERIISSGGRIRAFSEDKTLHLIITLRGGASNA